MNECHEKASTIPAFRTAFTSQTTCAGISLLTEQQTTRQFKVGTGNSNINNVWLHPTPGMGKLPELAVRCC